MKPVPLSDPAGTLRAYACERCLKLYSLVEMDEATACCTCSVCKNTLPCRQHEQAIYDAKQDALVQRWQREQAGLEETARRKSHNYAAAIKLRELIMRLSEREYSAGWMMGIEYVLWDCVLGSSQIFDHPRELAQLKMLSDLCGGWWEYEQFLTREEWDTRYAKHKEGPAHGVS